MLLRSSGETRQDCPAWIALGTSVAGTSHLARQIPCQDAHAGVLLDDGTLLLAVADGAGSARCSGEGASAAAVSAVASLANSLAKGAAKDADAWHIVLKAALAKAQQSIEDLADGADAAPSDFATTLLLAAVTPRHVASLQVGDGAIVIRSDGLLHVLPSAPGGEYINETTFITSSGAMESASVFVGVSTNVDGVAMFSDGVQFLAIEYSTGTAHAPFFDPIFAFAREEDAIPNELEAMLSSDRVNQLTDDDKTLVVAVRMDTAA